MNQIGYYLNGTFAFFFGCAYINVTRLVLLHHIDMQKACSIVMDLYEQRYR